MNWNCQHLEWWLLTYILCACVCVWTCLKPGVVEGLVDSDSLSRVQHQHASHQVLGTLRDVGPLARVHLDKGTRAHAHMRTDTHTHGRKPYRKNISNQDHLLWICITLSISPSIMSVKVKLSRSVGRAQYIFFQRNIWDLPSLMDYTVVVGLLWLHLPWISAAGNACSRLKSEKVADLCHSTSCWHCHACLYIVTNCRLKR